MQRKKIIISEIQYWKQSKLLPEHYCDFLIALYSGGDELDKTEIQGLQSVLGKQKKKRLGGIILLAILTVISSAILFVFSNYPIVTIGLVSLIVCVMLIYALRKAVSNMVILPFIYIACAFMLLALSLKLWMTYFDEQNMILIGLLILNCILWLFTGRLLNLLYFTISGSAGLLLIIGFLLL